MRAALALLLTLALAPAAAARPVEIRGADPERYTLDLRYEERGAGVLTGGERIEFVNRGPRALSSVWLRLWANGPDDCRPRRIRVEVEPPATAAAERVSCTALEVRLAAPVPPGASGVTKPSQVAAIGPVEVGRHSPGSNGASWGWGTGALMPASGWRAINAAAACLPTRIPWTLPTPLGIPANAAL